MVVREDGTKWACQSCLKGHRVSGCTHTDRELILVPKKGRPVTQCQHCRQERKKRSAHVKCDCGEDGKPHHAKEKCIHLREAEEKQKAHGFYDEDRDKDHGHLAAVAEEQGCCCHHGGKCSCAVVKKETSSDDGTPPYGKPAVQKPRLDTTRSEGHITVFQNGHHKPVHRKNHAAHESGMPYKLPLQRSHTDEAVSRVARRSVDSLSLEGNSSFNPMAHPPPTSAPFDTGRRQSKSEQTSPRLTPLNTYNGLPSAGFSSQDLGNFGLGDLNSGVPSSAGDTYAFPPLEPVSSIADSQFDPWSAFPSSDLSSLPNNNPFGAWPSNNDTNYVAQPALTAASSGTQSEVDDLPPEEDFGFNIPASQDGENGLSLTPETSVPSEPPDNRRSLPPDFFSNFGYNMRMNSDSSQHFNGMAGINEDVPKDVVGGGQTYAPGNAWQRQNGALKGSHRRTVGSSHLGSGSTVSTPGRPTSQSVGPANAPNDDLIKELFPGIDIAGSTSVPNGSAPRSDAAFSPTATSTPNTDMGAFDSTAGFTSQPWGDVPMSVASENYDASFDFNQNFNSNQNFSNWTQ